MGPLGSGQDLVDQNFLGSSVDLIPLREYQDEASQDPSSDISH